MISVRRIRLGEGPLFRKMRLAALNESPLAFASTYESAAQRSDESWREQADGTAAGVERATFIAFADTEPVGIAAVYRDKDRRDEGEVLQVWVAPEFRGGEVARELMEEILRWCQENGIRKVAAAVTTGNDRAMRFYTKLGFAATGPAKCGAGGGTVLVRDVGDATGE